MTHPTELSRPDPVIQQRLNDIRELFLGADAVILEGRYEGRLGKCTGVVLDYQHRYVFRVQPYRKRGSGDGLLGQHVQTRSFYHVDRFDFC